MKLKYIFLSTFFLSLFWGATGVLAASDEQKTIGSLSAPVTIEVYSDFQCPFCASWHKNTYPLIEKNYINDKKVQVVMRHFPIAGLHEGALPAARAVECAAEQGKMKEFIDVVYDNQSDLSTGTLESYAKDLGLNISKFNTCTTSPRVEDIINTDLANGQALGVSGTPSFFINGEIIQGAQPYSIFEEAINKALGGKPTKKLPKKTTGYNQINEPVRGDAKAPALITGYMGYNDPYSKSAWKTIDKLFAIYGDNIAFEFRHYPLEFQDPIYSLALAGECTLAVGGIESFFKFSDILMNNESTKQTVDTGIVTAQWLGLEISDCIANELLLPEVINDIDDGTAVGASGTPSFTINGEFIAGAVPLEMFREVIDRHLLSAGVVLPEYTEPTTKTEPTEVPYCGDGICYYGETCPEDCGDYNWEPDVVEPYDELIPYDEEPTLYYNYGFRNPLWLFLLLFL